jgi:hypothetical protein
MNKIKIVCEGSRDGDCRFVSCPFNHDIPEGYKCVLKVMGNEDIPHGTEIKITIDYRTMHPTGKLLIDGVEN